MSRKTNFRRVMKNLTKTEKTILALLAAAIVVGIIAGIILMIAGGNEKPKDESGQQIEIENNVPEVEDDVVEPDVDEPAEDNREEEPEEDVNDAPEEDVEEPEKEEAEITDEDPEETVVHTNKEEGASVEVQQVVNENETAEVTHGIDVSKYQGTIDWEEVANAGIDFAMVRVGYRTMSSGEIVADTNAKYNMQEAQKYGIKVGAYFFSTALNAEEAVEEADWVADYISKYKITYPVAFNCEGFQNTGSRQYEMTKSERTDVALAFLKQIVNRGYTGMFYASRGEMEGETEWETSRVSSLYKVWVAQYPGKPYPDTETSDYSGKHDMWQYTNQGHVPGIGKPVDVNVAYFGYEKEEEAQNEDAPEHVDADVEALMKFNDVDEAVTAKDKTNLRDKPSQGDDSTVVYVLENGEKAKRTGISDSGWSRVEVDGKVCYAVSSYLTTDLDYEPPKEEEDDGIATEFTAVDDKVTAKEVVNLRSIPSVTSEDSVVVAQIANGDVVKRTGINNELGWSRVEYEGQVLYCISSYLETVKSE